MPLSSASTPRIPGTARYPVNPRRGLPAGSRPLGLPYPDRRDSRIRGTASGGGSLKEPREIFDKIRSKPIHPDCLFFTLLSVIQDPIANRDEIGMEQFDQILFHRINDYNLFANDPHSLFNDLNKAI